MRSAVIAIATVPPANQSSSGVVCPQVWTNYPRGRWFSLCLNTTGQIAPVSKYDTGPAR